MRLLGALALSIVCAACVGAQGCGERRGATQTAAGASVAEEPTPAPDPNEKPSLRLIAFTDLSGYLRPCGCQSRPLGGIDKAAAQLATLRADGTPTVLLSAGDLLFGETPDGAASAADATTQETWKAETLVGIFDRLGLAAAAPGPHDLSYGAEVLAGLMAAGHFKLLPSAVGSGEEPENLASTQLIAGGMSVGVIGVSTFAPAGTELEPARESALIKRTQLEIDRARNGGATLVVALVSASQRLGRRLSGALHGADFVILGGNADSIDAPPNRVGGGYVLRARSQGHGLLVLDVFTRTAKHDDTFVDTSAWSREQNDADLKARIDELSARIRGWEHDDSADKADVAVQKTKLADLEKMLRGPVQAGAARRRFAARFIELAPEIQGDPQIAALIDAYDARVNDHNRVAFANVLAPAAAKGAAHYLGSQRCKSCHESAYAWWTKHPHGHAYKTLVDVHKEFNLSCVACHVTGYMRPGGSSLVHNEGLVNVGCESCHGPGSLHVASPDEEPAIGMTRDTPEEVCSHCHTPEHSDLFKFAKYRAKLIVPGHGLPLTAAERGSHK